MDWKRIFLLVPVFLIGSLVMTAWADDVNFLTWAPTPPMGWNSWDCYGTAVTEAQTKANADYMAMHLARHGWQYIVVDIQWYEPDAKGWDYRPGAKLEMDANGRLLPATNRFPSAAGGKGFKSLADYVHGKGLKFGVHILRGIPRQAVAANLPILGAKVGAADVADTSSTCRWNSDMYGVDVSKPGGQEYYDSIFAQFAAWGIDFVKVDDLSRPYHGAEIAAIRKAIDKSGRAIVFSTSPGPTPLVQGADIAAHANMWRISDDFWDEWSLLRAQFSRCADWAPFSGGGHYADADMLPLGVIRAVTHSSTRFTKDEQRTMMTLWSICRSPLIFGGDLPQCDDFTLSLLTNDEVLSVDQHCANGRQLFRSGELIAWTADVDNSKDKYLAVFNVANDVKRAPAAVSVNLADLGFAGRCKVRDLWKGEEVGVFWGKFERLIAPHAAGLYRIALDR